MSNANTYGTVKIRLSPRARIYNYWELCHLLDILKHIKILEKITLTSLEVFLNDIQTPSNFEKTWTSPLWFNAVYHEAPGFFLKNSYLPLHHPIIIFPLTNSIVM